MTKIGKFYGIGVGPGDIDLLTVKGLKALKSVDFIYQLAGSKEGTSVAGNIIAGLKDRIKGEIVNLKSPMDNDLEKRKNAWSDNAQNIIEKLKLGYDCAFITLGDPMVYSTCGHLLDEFNEYDENIEVEIIPGITAFQAAAAATQTILADAGEKLLVIPAYKQEHISDELIQDAENVVVMKAYKTKNMIVENLVEKNNYKELTYVSRLGLENEVIETDINTIKSLPEEYLSLFILKK